MPLPERQIHNLSDLPPGGISPWPERAVPVAVDDTVHVSGLYERVESAAGRYVRETLPFAYRLPASRLYHYLGYLPPADVVARAEGAVRVTIDDPPVERRLHIGIEGRAGLHVREVRRVRQIYLPGMRQRDDLRQLPPGGVSIRAEGAVRVSGDRAPAHQIPNPFVEVIYRRHIAERYLASLRRGCRYCRSRAACATRGA